jgi:hypothetical protein
MDSLHGPQAEGHGQHERDSRPDMNLEVVLHILALVFHCSVMSSTSHGLRFGWLPNGIVAVVYIYIHPAAPWAIDETMICMDYPLIPAYKPG